MPKTRPKRWTRRSEAEIRRILDEMAGSRLSQRAFAEKCGVPLSTLTWWRRKLGRGQRKRGDSGALVPVVLSAQVGPNLSPPAGSAPGFEVELRSGHVLRVPPDFDADGLKDLLSVLDRPC